VVIDATGADSQATDRTSSATSGGITTESGSSQLGAPSSGTAATGEGTPASAMTPAAPAPAPAEVAPAPAGPVLKTVPVNAAMGEYAPPIEFPVIPVAIAVLPSGKVHPLDLWRLLLPQQINASLLSRRLPRAAPVQWRRNALRQSASALCLFNTICVSAELVLVQVLAWAAYMPDDFDRVGRFVPGGGGSGTTQHAVFDSSTDTVTGLEVANTQHDMFCPGISMLFNGDLIITGGQNADKTSLYQFSSGTWAPGPDMHISRGYGSSITLSNGKV
jgi:hypothetical protein